MNDRRRLVEPPRTKADSWPLSFAMLQALLDTLHEEDDISKDARMELAQEFLKRCYDVDALTTAEISHAQGMTRTAMQKDERNGLITIRNSRMLDGFR